MPSGPLVSGVSSLMKIWTIVPKASVTMARYGPVTRRAGTASSTPKAEVTPIPARMPHQIPSLKCRNSTAAE